jgi:hypothetical protein
MAFLKGLGFFLTFRWGRLYRHIRAEKIKTIQRKAISQKTSVTGANSISRWVSSTPVVWNRQMDCWECEYTIIIDGREIVAVGQTNKALDTTNVGSKY